MLDWNNGIMEILEQESWNNEHFIIPLQPPNQGGMRSQSGSNFSDNGKRNVKSALIIGSFKFRHVRGLGQANSLPSPRTSLVPRHSTSN